MTRDTWETQFTDHLKQQPTAPEVPVVDEPGTTKRQRKPRATANTSTAAAARPKGTKARAKVKTKAK